jgi:hypothetical protein
MSVITVLTQQFPVLKDVWTNVLLDFLLPHEQTIRVRHRVFTHIQSWYIMPRSFSELEPEPLHVFAWVFGYNSNGMFFRLIGSSKSHSEYSMCWVYIWHFDKNGHTNNQTRLPMYWLATRIVSDAKWKYEVEIDQCMQCSIPRRPCAVSKVYDHAGNVRMIRLCRRCVLPQQFTLFNQSDGRLWAWPALISLNLIAQYHAPPSVYEQLQHRLIDVSL